MRFILGAVALAIAALFGLFIYGGMMEPETRLIEEEAVRGASS